MMQMMRVVVRLLWPALLLAVTAACDGASGPSRAVPLGREFDSGPESRSWSRTSSLVIRFDGVSADSRCPLGVFCIRAGDATVTLTARRLPTASATLTLHTDPGLGSEASFQDYRVRLVELNPHPRQNEPIAPGDYVVTLLVTRPVSSHLKR